MHNFVRVNSPIRYVLCNPGLIPIVLPKKSPGPDREKNVRRCRGKDSDNTCTENQCLAGLIGTVPLLSQHWGVFGGDGRIFERFLWKSDGKVVVGQNFDLSFFPFSSEGPFRNLCRFMSIRDQEKRQKNEERDRFSIMMV